MEGRLFFFDESEVDYLEQGVERSWSLEMLELTELRVRKSHNPANAQATVRNGLFNLAEHPPAQADVSARLLI